jgi:hypothetical protein
MVTAPFQPWRAHAVNRVVSNGYADTLSSSPYLYFASVMCCHHSTNGPIMYWLNDWHPQTAWFWEQVTAALTLLQQRRRRRDVDGIAST